jgi:biopolymer transport protein ExbD
MAFGRLETRKPDAPMSEINVTPMVDVMLVLLVIFILTAPLMTSAIRLDLPQSEGGQSGAAPQAVSLVVDVLIPQRKGDPLVFNTDEFINKKTNAEALLGTQP